MHADQQGVGVPLQELAVYAPGRLPHQARPGGPGEGTCCQRFSCSFHSSFDDPTS